MYRIYCDGQLISDSRIEELCVNNPTVQLEVNTSNWFTFSFPPTHPYIDAINHLTSIIRVERDGELLFQGFCSKESTDIFGNKSISCEGELAYLNDSVLRPARYQAETVESLFTKYITQHNLQVEARKRFAIGRITVHDPNDYIYCYTNMNSTIEEIEMDLINDYGGYLFVRYEDGVKYLDYLAEPEVEAQQTIELGKNLLDYNSNIEANVIATRVIPLGDLLEDEVIEGLPTRLDIKSVNDGKDYLDNEQAIANFGIVTRTVVFDKVTTATELKRKGQQWLNENQFANVTIDLSAIDLSVITNEFQQFKLFDRIRVVSEYHGMDRRFMLSKMKLNLNNPEQDLYFLGQDQYATLTVQSVSLSSNLGHVVESAPQTEVELLRKAKNQTVAMLTNNGYTVFNMDQNGRLFEILIMDNINKEIASDIWRWNKDGLSHSSTGYTGAYATVMDINGNVIINDNRIVTRKAIDYSQSDIDRLQDIIDGVEIATDADYEKLDLNNDGLLDANDITAIQNIISSGDDVDFTCPVKINEADKFASISTNKVFISNKGVRTENAVIDGELALEKSTVSVRNSTGTKYQGVSGDYSNIQSIKVLNGIVVDVII